MYSEKNATLQLNFAEIRCCIPDLLTSRSEEWMVWIREFQEIEKIHQIQKGTFTD